jgi:hypothetical protein
VAAEELVEPGACSCTRACAAAPNAKVQPHAARAQLSSAPELGAACRLQRYVRRPTQKKGVVQMYRSHSGQRSFTFWMSGAPPKVTLLS